MVVAGIVYQLLQVYFYILLARVILEWVRMFMQGRSPGPLAVIYGALYDLTEPVLRPLRRLIPPLRLGAAALDLSVLVAFILIFLLQQLVVTLA